MATFTLQAVLRPDKSPTSSLADLKVTSSAQDAAELQEQVSALEEEKV